MQKSRTAEAPYRAARFALRALDARRAEHGVLHLRSPVELGPIERSLIDYLPRWAALQPARIFLARMSEDGTWRTLTYARAWEQVRAIGQALLERKLDAERPIAILSGNSIEHAILSLAGMAVGVPVAPLSPNYSLLPGGERRLAEIAEVLQPGLVFAQNAEVFARARSIPAFAAIEWVSVAPVADATPFAALLAASPDQAFDAAFDAVGPDTVAKVLFTSGSTGSPKGVINTQRMLCAVAAMSGLLVLPVDAPIQVEWMPWHHTMGGNATFCALLKNGGSLYIDDGRPTPDGFAKTIAALKTVSPTSLQTVPAGFMLLIAALRSDAELRAKFFEKIVRVSYGGAALPDGQIEEFQEIAVASVGERIPVISGYGTTETAPSICITHWPSEVSGEIGSPFPGLDVKLVPDEDRYEIRVKGPNVTPGYLRRPDLTAQAFDEDGYYKVGDAVTFMDPDRPEMGLRFAGRLSENFKLTTGTWVLAGDLRLTLLNATAPALLDIVIAGENRDEIAILAWPNPKVPDNLITDVNSKGDPGRLAADTKLISYVAAALDRYNNGKSSSARIAAFRLLETPASLAAGEITDKGYVNQRAVLNQRGALVESLFDQVPSAGVVDLRRSALHRSVA